MSKLLDVDEKLKEVEKEKNMTEADFDLLLDSVRKMIKEGNKLEEGVIDIFETYTKAIRDLNKELNYLYKYKGETANK